jgi:TM2 domain-containing membrane protein YozV
MNTPQQVPIQQPPQQFYGNMYPQPQVNQVVYSEPVQMQDYAHQPAQQPDQGHMTVEESTAWVSESDIRYKDGVVAICLNLFLPGLGHFLFGQKVKGITFLLSFILYSTLISVLSIIFVGFLFFIPLIYVWIAQLCDGYWLAERLKKGYPIMKGEHSANWIRFTGAGLLVKPSFVSGSDKAPQDWYIKTSEVQQQV